MRFYDETSEPVENLIILFFQHLLRILQWARERRSMLWLNIKRCAHCRNLFTLLNNRFDREICVYLIFVSERKRMLRSLLRQLMMIQNSSIDCMNSCSMILILIVLHWSSNESSWQMKVVNEKRICRFFQAQWKNRLVDVITYDSSVSIWYNFNINVNKYCRRS